MGLDLANNSLQGQGVDAYDHKAIDKEVAQSDAQGVAGHLARVHLCDLLGIDAGEIKCMKRLE